MHRSTSHNDPSDQQGMTLRSIIAAGGVAKCAPEGALAFRWAGQPRSFIFVKSGKLSVQFRTRDRQVPWAECRAMGGHDCMPVTVAILSERPLSVRAVCMSPTTWIELSPLAFGLLVHEQPEFRHALFAGHVHRLPTFFARISTQNALGLDQRIADWLLGHAHANAVHATHADIATDLLTAREVVSRRLKAFASRGWIEQRRGCIRIEAPAALSRVSRGMFAMRKPARVSP